MNKKAVDSLARLSTAFVSEFQRPVRLLLQRTRLLWYEKRR